MLLCPLSTPSTVGGGAVSAGLVHAESVNRLSATEKDSGNLERCGSQGGTRKAMSRSNSGRLAGGSTQTAAPEDAVVSWARKEAEEDKKQRPASLVTNTSFYGYVQHLSSHPEVEVICLTEAGVQLALGALPVDRKQAVPWMLDSTQKLVCMQ